MFSRSFRFIHLLKTAKKKIFNYSVNTNLGKKFPPVFCFDQNNNNKFQKHFFCTKIVEDAENEIELEINEELVADEGHVDFINFTTPKNLMYQSEDPVISELNACANFEELFSVIDRLGWDIMNVQHWVQSILVIWELIKYEEKQIILKLFNDRRFDEVVERNVRAIESMTPEECTCVLLYMNKIGVPLEDDRIQKIIQHFLGLINDNETRISLVALSRFIVALCTRQGNVGNDIVCKDTLPLVLKFLDECSTSEDLRLITISFNCLHRLIRPETLDVYEEKIWQLLNTAVINSDSVRCILGVVNFLNHPQWSQNYTKLVRSLSVILEQKICTFQTKELVSLFRIFQSHLEPASMIPAITEQSKKLLDSTPSAELLACAVLYSLPKNRKKMIDIAKEIVYSEQITNPTTLPALFKALRLLKISNLKLVNAYWDKVCVEIETNLMDQKSHRIARHCHRYMHFNNNLGGTYRHMEFERIASKFVLKELETGISQFVPKRFARYSSFIIAYGISGGRLAFPDFIVTKLEEMSGQFSVLDCLMVSRGLQIALEMRFRQFVPKELGAQIARLENLLNTCADRHISRENLSLSELNSIVRTFNNRKCKYQISIS